MESIYIWMFNRYELLIDAGRTLLGAGAIAIIFGIIGGALKHAQTSMAATPNGGATTERMLADAWPSIPTGWIPETLPGFLLAGLLVVAGISITMIGKHLKRIAEY
ncbi:hypothetical protein QR66_01770 [Chromobacterium piscinae]|nr:hypothetical protein QR66_01770 [Chromobacterium piscinae]